MSASSHELTLAEAVPLAHTLVARAAAQHDVRVLFIKGPVAAEQGLRPIRPSVDVDVLVDPRRRGLLAAALDELGWVDDDPHHAPTVLPQHSLTHRHESWPCELDLHDRFPGFFADPQAVFEALWSRRTAVRVAGQELQAPDRNAHALILALHSLRDPHAASRQVDLRDLEQRLVPELSAEDRADLSTLAHRLGAADTAAPFLRAVGAPPVGIGSTSAADLRAWRLRTEPADTTAVSWVAELRRLPLRAWPRYLWYAVWLSDAELRLANPWLAPGRAPVLRARGRRLLRGASALPSALRHVGGQAGSQVGVATTAPDRAASEAPDPASPPEVVVVTLMRPEGETGVQTHLQTLIAQLRAQGHPVSLVTPFSARSPLLRPAFALRMPLQLLSGPLGVWWYREGHAHYLRGALRRHLAQGTGARVVYAQCPVSAEVALSTRTDEPVVMVEHFNISQADEWAEKGLIPVGGRLYGAIRAFEARVLPRLDGIVYVSEFARRLLEERIPALAATPSLTVPNFVSLVERGVAPAPDRDLITVGTLEPRKNQAYLLQVLAAAAAEGHRHTLTVVGDGPDRARLERLAGDLGVGDRVSFLGFHPDPRSLMARHRAYCHAATMENLPVALLEAMAEGLPIIAAAVGGIPTVVDEGVDGVFWPLGDPPAAARILADLLGDDARLEKMAAAARESIRESYTAEAVVPALHGFLARVGR